MGRNFKPDFTFVHTAISNVLGSSFSNILSSQQVSLVRRTIASAYGSQPTMVFQAPTNLTGAGVWNIAVFAYEENIVLFKWSSSFDFLYMFKCTIDKRNSSNIFPIIGIYAIGSMTWDLKRHPWFYSSLFSALYQIMTTYVIKSKQTVLYVP